MVKIILHDPKLYIGARKGYSWFWWPIHNIIAHPISEILYWFRLYGLANWLHDETVPIHEIGDGRG